ncbi:hypothetical protein B0H13DRAFT_1850242 [Mycena leptocephala]|nr:hypothetical protein B0H13DRAFT_1850242 [Mycena leptocephala]
MEASVFPGTFSGFRAKFNANVSGAASSNKTRLCSSFVSFESTPLYEKRMAALEAGAAAFATTEINAVCKLIVWEPLRTDYDNDDLPLKPGSAHYAKQYLGRGASYAKSSFRKLLTGSTENVKSQHAVNVLISRQFTTSRTGVGRLAAISVLFAILPSFAKVLQQGSASTYNHRAVELNW